MAERPRSPCSRDAPGARTSCDRARLLGRALPVRGRLLPEHPLRNRQDADAESTRPAGRRARARRPAGLTAAGRAVYAQVFELLGTERGERLNRSIYGELLPALRTEDGF